jgi:hypothetical protein
LLVLPVIFLTTNRERDRWASALLMAFVIVIAFLPPLLTRRFKGSYLQRMEALDNQASSGKEDLWEGSGSLVYKAADIIGREAFVVIVYLLLCINIIYHAGRASAANQRVFPIANTSPATVVLFMTSDRLICASFDRKTKMIEPVFTVINLGDKPDLTLSLMEVGPLKLNRISVRSTSMAITRRGKVLSRQGLPPAERRRP